MRPARLRVPTAPLPRQALPRADDALEGDDVVNGPGPAWRPGWGVRELLLAVLGSAAVLALVVVALIDWVAG